MICINIWNQEKFSRFLDHNLAGSGCHELAIPCIEIGDNNAWQRCSVGSLKSYSLVSL
jgi:hypothetical protein